MVSLQSPVLSPPDNSTTPQKRKTFEVPNNCMESQVFEKRPKSEFQNFMDDIELHLETPLPSEWQRCLDIQSGKIHFYNTKTHTRTSTDPRKIIRDDHDHDHDDDDDHDDHQYMSLDLELNLTTTSEPSSFVRKEHMNRATTTTNNNNYYINNHMSYSSPSSTASTSLLFSRDLSVETTKQKMSTVKRSANSAPPWLALEADRNEMVATVCMRCHMLVMLCRSSPACPNCKFVHPPDKTPSNFVQLLKL